MAHPSRARAPLCSIALREGGRPAPRPGPASALPSRPLRCLPGRSVGAGRCADPRTLAVEPSHPPALAPRARTQLAKAPSAVCEVPGEPPAARPGLCRSSAGRHRWERPERASGEGLRRRPDLEPSGRLLDRLAAPPLLPRPSPTRSQLRPRHGGSLPSLGSQ